jgi:hypothetical protein
MIAARPLVPDLKGSRCWAALERDAYRHQYQRELPALATEIEVINLSSVPKNLIPIDPATESLNVTRQMFALLFLFLGLSASPFKSTSRLEAENAALRIS